MSLHYSDSNKVCDYRISRSQSATMNSFDQMLDTRASKECIESRLEITYSMYQCGASILHRIHIWLIVSWLLMWQHILGSSELHNQYAITRVVLILALVRSRGNDTKHRFGRDWKSLMPDSDSLIAEITIRSPQKLCISLLSLYFHYKNTFSGSKYPEKQFI